MASDILKKKQKIFLAKVAGAITTLFDKHDADVTVTETRLGRTLINGRVVELKLELRSVDDSGNPLETHSSSMSNRDSQTTPTPTNRRSKRTKNPFS